MTTAHDWLKHALNEGSLRGDEVIDVLLTMVDGDQIQDAYQEEMDQNGYFEPLKEGHEKT